MGGANFGAFAQGLVSSMAQAQERQTNKAYREALMQQTKAQVKMLESQEVIKNFEIMKNAAAMSEMQGVPMEQIMQMLPQKTATPETPAIPQQGLLAKIFGGGGQVVPPSGQQPRGLIQKVFTGITGQPQPQGQSVMATGQTLPNIIAQGQTQGMIQPQPARSPEEAARRKDIADKVLYGTQPWREKEAQQSQYVGQKVTVMTPQGPATRIINKRGDTMQEYALPPEYSYQETQPTPGGPTYSVPVPKHGVPPTLIREQPKGETPQQAGQSQAIIGGLQDGMKFLETIKDPETNKINQKTIAGMTAPLMGKIGGMPGTDARKGLSLFRNAVDAIVRQRTGAAIREDEWPYYNSIYLPDFKDSEQLQQEKVMRLNRDLAGALAQSDPNQTKINRSLSVKPQLPQQNRQQMLIDAAKARGWKQRPDGTWGP